MNLRKTIAKKMSAGAAVTACGTVVPGQTLFAPDDPSRPTWQLDLVR